MSDARMATTADLPAIGVTLAAAFEDDPVWRFLVPDERRWRFAHRVFRAEAYRRMGTGRVHVTPGIEAVAVWSRPDPPKDSPWALLRFAPAALRCFGLGVRKGQAVDAGLKKHHPKQPHWYLAVLGTAPPHQGRGFGSVAMAPVLERCDADGTPAYLESSKEQNVPFYTRYGFVAADPIVPTPGCPPVWPMWRDPQ